MLPEIVIYNPNFKIGKIIKVIRHSSQSEEIKYSGGIVNCSTDLELGNNYKIKYNDYKNSGYCNTNYKNLVFLKECGIWASICCFILPNEIDKMFLNAKIPHWQKISELNFLK